MQSLFLLVLFSLLGLGLGQVDFNTTLATGGGVVSGTAGYWASITVIPLDSNGNYVPNTSLNFSITMVRLTDNKVVTPQISYTSTGNYSILYQPTVSGNFSLSLTGFNGDVTGLISGNPFDIIIVPGIPIIGNTLAISSGYPNSGTAGMLTSFSVQFRDSYLNPVTVDPDQVELQILPDPQYPSQPCYAGPVVWNEASLAITITYQVNKTTPVYLTVYLESVPYYQIQISISPGTLNVAASTVDLSLFDSVSLFAGLSGSITITPTDSYGNAISPAFISINADQFQAYITLLHADGTPTTDVTILQSAVNNPVLSKATAYTITVPSITLAGKYNLLIKSGSTTVGNPSTFTILAGDISGTLSYITGPFGSIQSVNVPQVYTIVAIDSYGNHETFGGQASEFYAEVFSSQNVVVTQIVDPGNGTYFVEFTFNSSGTYILDAFFSLDVLQGSGQNLYAVAPTDPSNTIAYGAGLKSCQIGAVCRFVVQARDTYNNNQTLTNDNITVTLNGNPFDTTIQYIGTGIYAVTYTGATGSKIGVYIDGNQIPGSPFSVYMSPSNASIGVIICIVILVVAALALIAYIAYRRHKLMLMRKEWELKKAMAYKEYQTTQGAPVPLTNMMKTPDEPEWEDDEFANIQHKVAEENPDDHEWAVMSQWIQQTKTN